MDKFVKAGDFVEVVVDSLEKDGIHKGTHLYLAGDSFVPIEGEDYKYERVFIGARIQGYHIQADEQPFLVAGKSLAPVSEPVRKILEEYYQEDFGQQGE